MATQVESIKRIPGTRFMVDGFRFAKPAAEDPVTRHFLTHYHGDHYTGLTRSFPGGTIYASDITADLLIQDFRLKVAEDRRQGQGPGEGPGSGTGQGRGKGPGGKGGGGGGSGGGSGGGCTLIRMPIGERMVIDGVGVTALPANHCPGAVMLLFEVPRRRRPQRAPGGGGTCDDVGAEGAGADCGGSGDGDTHVILHTGDCRWQRWMRDDTILSRIKVETLLLDTTYCLPRWSFPSQEEAVASMVKVCREALSREPSTLFLSSAYHIGKERAYLGCAEALGIKVWCSPSKARTLRLLRLPESWSALITRDPLEAGLHVLSGAMRPEGLLTRYGLPVPEQRGAAAAGAGGAPGGAEDGGGGGDEGDEGEGEQLLARLKGRWKALVGFRPTGWSYRRSGGLSCWRLGAAEVWGVPYSEHSSFTDLQDCVRSLRPRRIVPTVNAPTPAAARAIVDRFAHLMDLSGDRSRLDAYFTKEGALQRTAGQPPGGGAGASSCGSGGGGGVKCLGPGLGGPVDGSEDMDGAGAAVEPPPGPEAADALDDRGSEELGAGAAQRAEDCQTLEEAPSASPYCSESCPLPGDEVAGAEGPSDPPALAGVDLEEQRRLMEGFEREQRLRRSLQQRDAARAAKKRRCSSSSGGGGGGGGGGDGGDAGGIGGCGGGQGDGGGVGRGRAPAGRASGQRGAGGRLGGGSSGAAAAKGGRTLSNSITSFLN